MWNAKDAENLQVFRGSHPPADVFTQDLMRGGACCPPGSVDVTYDKLARRVRFDNGLAHLNPLGGNEKFNIPFGDGLTSSKAAIVDHINKFGVGAQISVIAIPTYAFLTGLNVHVAGAETGLTFDVVTRNGLALPADYIAYVDVTGEACAPIRTLTVSTGEAPIDLEGIGALGTGVLFRDYFAKSCCGTFSLESDEIILEVASMPAGGSITGDFSITVAASYEVINRAEA